MKTIHALIAVAALASAPLAAHAQSADATTTTTTDAAQATDATGEPETGDATARQLDPATTDVKTTGTGTGDIGSTGTGTGDVGSTGTGTGDIGSTGTGTGDIGSTGTGTGTAQVAPYQPEVSLATPSGSLRTPGTVGLMVSLAADASLDPPQARDISVPLASSSSSCTVPAAVTVAWSSAAGGSASVDVTCKKAGAQTVTISSGTASTSFTTR